MDEVRYDVPGYQLYYPQIGEGGFGRVFRGHATESSILFAIKIIDPSAFVDREKSVARFHMEVAALARLEHPHIVKYIDSGMTNGSPSFPFLVTEFVDDAAFTSSIVMEDSERARFVIDVLQALHASHEMGIVHRDIKPSNVFCRRSTMTPAVLDFGLVYDSEDTGRIAVTSRYVGSAGYIPPEVISGEESSRANHDIYSCGVLLYESFAGRRPNWHTYTPLATLRPALSPLDPVIQRSIGPAKERYLTAASFSADLDNALRRMQAAASLKDNNPRAEAFRTRAADKVLRSRTARAEADRAAQESQRQWRECHSIVMTGSEQAFDDMLTVAKELDDAFRVVRHEDSAATDGLSPLVELSEPEHMRIVLCLDARSKESVVSWPKATSQVRTAGSVRLTLREKQSLPTARLRPEWLIFSMGRSQHYPAQNAVGGIAACFVGGVLGLYAKPLTQWSGSVGRTSRYPVHLDTAEDVRRYVTDVIGEALGLNNE